MKTLIIAGSYWTKNSVLCYSVSLYGQTVECPVCIYITDVELTMNAGYGYDHMIAECKEKYAEYFKTDLFNVITLNKLVNLGTLPQND